ncbi:MAG: hypothetical protein AAGA85_06285 [Bacteroidota bacterium]
MKQLPIALCLSLLLAAATAEAQKLREKDLVGTSWKLNIDIEQALEEAEREVEEEDNLLATLVLRGVSGVVEGIIENIDVYFDFEDDNEVRVYVDAFGTEEVEYTYWEVNKRGELVIEDNEHFDSDGPSYWVMDQGVLVLDESQHDADDANIFLEQIK